MVSTLAPRARGYRSRPWPTRSSARPTSRRAPTAPCATRSSSRGASRIRRSSSCTSTTCRPSGSPRAACSTSRCGSRGRERLDDLCERFSDRAHLIAATRRGRPSAEIVAHAERVGAQMIVMSTRARPALSAAILGSVTADVLHESPLPVLTVQPDARVDGVGARPGDDRSGRLLRAGARGGRRLRGGPPGAPSRAAQLPPPDVRAPPTARRSSRRRPRRARASARRPGSTRGVDALSTSLAIITHLERGAPEESAVRILRDEGIDVVVLGTHARVGLRRWVLGSVAERMVRTCEVPVMVVRGLEEAS